MVMVSYNFGHNNSDKILDVDRYINCKLRKKELITNFNGQNENLCHIKGECSQKFHWSLIFYFVTTWVNTIART